MTAAVPRAIVKHEHDPRLQATVRSVIGYRAEQHDAEHGPGCARNTPNDGGRCLCGAVWRGPWRGSFDAARRDARERNRETTATVE